ncbi:hypothetical protein JT06_15865 [Desulfobulbus sp. Tol-SR]|nr:hypothetical protein JT06_15865 [Desulfobulbus sp. Tol-SR]
MATLELSVKSNAVSELGKINRQFDSTSQKAEKLKKQFSTLATPVSNKWLTYLGISEIGRQVSSLTSSLASGAAAIVTAFTGINSTIEQTIVMLENATGSAESGKEAFAYIVDLAQKAPYSIAVLTDSFVKLRTAGIQDTKRVLESLVDSVAAFGGTDEQLKLVTIAMQQMAGKGVISMEELRRQFAEQVPTAIRAMASELDMTILEMTKKIAKGQLSSDLGIPALVEGLEKLHTGAAAKRMETFQGSIAHARNEWILLLKDIGDGNGSFKSISNMINSVANSMKEFRTSAEGMAIIDGLSQKIADSMKKIAENPEMVYQFFVEIGQYASMAGSALGGLVEIINNVISAYDLMKGATSFTDWGQGVIDTKNFDMSKYALIRSELLEITKLQKQIDQMKPDILPDNPFNMISQAQKIKDMFSDLGNPDFMKKYEFEFDEAKVQARIDELKRSIEDKLSGNKPKIDVDTSKAEMSLSKLLKIDPSNEFAKVSTTMGNVADSFSIAIDSIINEYAKVSEELEKENAQILEKERNLADELRGIFREGMTEGAAYDDLIAQINEYKVAAEEAAKAGDWGGQLAALQRAADLIRSLPTSGITETKIVSQEEVERARQIYEYYDRVSRGGRAMDISKYAQEYEKLKAIYEGEGEQKDEIISKQDQINQKATETKEVGEKILELERKHKEELEAKKKALETQVDEYKSKLEALATQSQGLNDTTGQLGAVWVQVGDTFAHVAGEISGKLEALQQKLKDLMGDAKSLDSSVGGIDIPGRAVGGPVAGGNPYIIGEKGPELFVPSTNGTVIPNNQLKKSGSSVDLNITVNGGDRIRLQGTNDDVNRFIKAMREKERYAA